MSISPPDPIELLLKLQDDHRKVALSKPKDKSEFGYGEAVGIHNGIQLAIDKLVAANKENGEVIKED